MPFRNRSETRQAGELVALAFVRELMAAPPFEVVEPGVVRDWLFRYRLVSAEGVSLDTVRVMLTAIEADFILSGEVYDYDEWRGSPETPRVTVSAQLIERRSERVVWQASSGSTGNNGVWFFGLGQQHSADRLTCRLASAAIDSLMRGDVTPQKSLTEH